MKQISLTQGMFALVDDADFEYLNQWKWHASYYGYAERRQHIKSTRKNQKFKMIKMHRLIMQTPDDMVTDHINGDKLDNRRSNLRVCTLAGNAQNKGMSKNNKSGYKGVSWSKTTKKWVAQIKVDYQQYILGHFDDPLVAAREYDARARQEWGDYAKVNFS